MDTGANAAVLSGTDIEPGSDCVRPFDPLCSMHEDRVLTADDHAVVRNGIAALLATTSDISIIAEAADGTEATANLVERSLESAVAAPRADGNRLADWL